MRGLESSDSDSINNIIHNMDTVFNIYTFAWTHWLKQTYEESSADYKRTSRL